MNHVLPPFLLDVLGGTPPFPIRDLVDNPEAPPAQLPHPLVLGQVLLPRPQLVRVAVSVHPFNMARRFELSNNVQQHNSRLKFDTFTHLVVVFIDERNCFGSFVPLVFTQL